MSMATQFLYRRSSSGLCRVEGEAPVGAFVQCLLERLPSDESADECRLASERAFGVGCRMQLVGHAATGEPVIPGGGEGAVERIGPLVVPHARLVGRHLGG